MYPQYNHLNVPTWIIGPALGEGPLIDRPGRGAESVAGAGADPTVAICAIQFAPGSVCYEALSLTLLLFLANTLAATNKPRIVYEVTEIDIWPSDFRFTCRLASY